MEHFSKVNNSTNTIPKGVPPVHFVGDCAEEFETALLNAPWTVSEVVEAVGRLPKGKASGPDGILNEHLMQSGAVLPHVTALLNACLEQGRVPVDWRKCLLTVIPRSKGNLGDPKNWRGIAKRNVLGKLLSSLVAQRLEDYLSYRDLIPPEQHGFARGKSTLSAVGVLLKKIKETCYGPGRNKTPVYAVFIDYRSAFDLASRSVIVEKLACAGVSGGMLHLIHDMLQLGWVSLEDGASELAPFPQTNGVAQGDNLSPKLFNVLLSDLPVAISRDHDIVYTLLYADDAVLYSCSEIYLQRALRTLERYSASNGLIINVEKTKVMKFGVGGTPTKKLALRLGANVVEVVSHFDYLGMTLCQRGVAVSRHVASRIRKARLAFGSIPTPRVLSLKTALALFDMKIAPIASYGIGIVWDELPVTQLDAFDKLKASFLRLALGVHRSSRNLTRIRHETLAPDALDPIILEKAAAVDSTTLGRLGLSHMQTLTSLTGLARSSRCTRISTAQDLIILRDALNSIAVRNSRRSGRMHLQRL